MAKQVETGHLEEEVLSFVRKTEEGLMEASRRWAKAVDEFIPMETPAMRDMVKAVLDFTEKTLEVQLEFARKMLDEVRATMTELDKTTRAAATRHRPRTTRVAHRTPTHHTQVQHTRTTTKPDTARKAG